MKAILSKLERVPLRDAWKHEAGDFTPWLAESENLAWLADTIGLSDLECVAVELRFDSTNFVNVRLEQEIQIRQD